MTMLIGTSSGQVARSPNFDDADFAVDFTSDPDIVDPGTVTTYQDYDSIFKKSTPATVDPAWNFSPRELVRGSLSRGAIATSTDTSIAMISANRVSRVADGTAGIIVDAGFPRRRWDKDFTRQSGQTVNVFQNFVDGALGAKMSDSVDDAIASKDVTAKPIFSSTSPWTRNSSCWAASWDLTGISLTTPRCTVIATSDADNSYVCGAEHYQAGDTIKFLASDGTVVTRTISSRENVGPANSSDDYATDIWVGKLDSALPSAVKAYKMLPAGWRDTYCPGLANGVPVLSLDQNANALVRDWYDDSTMDAFRRPTDTQRALFYGDWISGDSSSTVLTRANDDEIFVTHATFGGAGSGPDYDSHLATINTALGTLTGGATVSTVDLSSELIWNYDDYMKSLGWTARWKLDETSGTTAADATGNRHDGTIHGGVTLGQSGPATGIPAMTFDGSSGYIEIPDFQLDPTKHTVVLWFQCPAENPSIQQCLFSQQYGTKSTREFVRNAAGGPLSGYCNDTFLGNTDQVANDEWIHLVVTYDGTYSNRYINGVLKTATPVSAIPASDTPFYLGIFSPTIGGYLSGAVADAAVGNSMILTVDQIAFIRSLALNEWSDA